MEEDVKLPNQVNMASHGFASPIGAKSMDRRRVQQRARLLVERRWQGKRLTAVLTTQMSVEDQMVVEGD